MLRHGRWQVHGCLQTNGGGDGLVNEFVQRSNAHGLKHGLHGGLTLAVVAAFKRFLLVKIDFHWWFFCGFMLF